MCPLLPLRLALHDMIGTWVHVGRPGQVGRAALRRVDASVRTGKIDPDARRPQYRTGHEHFAGPRLMAMSMWNQDYADERWIERSEGFKFRQG